jgi:2-haloacid dehalogenase
MTTQQEDSLMSSYDRLALFPDVQPGLDLLLASAADDISAVLFSNGTRAMVDASVRHSFDDPSLFERTVVVDEMPDDERVYKPAEAAYRFLEREVGVQQQERVWLVSSNPFDIVGAARAGWRTAWVDRVGAGWVDGLAAGGPDVEGAGLEDVVRGILRVEGLGG